MVERHDGLDACFQESVDEVAVVTLAVLAHGSRETVWNQSGPGYGETGRYGMVGLKPVGDEKILLRSDLEAFVYFEVTAGHG